jgi:hypothetical protein
MNTPRRINFRRIADAALGRAPLILLQWLPSGRRDGAEWVCRNPTRDDRRSGSFKINLRTGRWGDFATDDCGSDLISLAAYLHRLPQAEAALKVAHMLGIDPYDA